MNTTTGRPAAFFDLDRTLIRVNSGFLYALYERRHGRVTTRQFLTATMWVGLYHLSLVDIEDALARAVAQYRGVHDSLLVERTREFFEAEVRKTCQPGALAALEQHRSSGHPLVLLTASSPYLSKLASETWGLDAWLCNGFPLDASGKLDGTLERPVCYGAGKVTRAERWAADHGVDLDRSYFYSDSYSDLPMLERVGEPRVVNPDPRLRREARRRDWPILDWSRPG